MSPEKSIITFADSLCFSDLPAEVITAVKRMTMNTLAAMLAGSANDNVVRLNRLVHSWGGRPESTVFMHKGKVPSVDAIFVNAAMARAMDFDDFHVQTGMHASASLIPVALAVSEAKGAIDGKSFITAVALGAEILCRMRAVPDQCIGVSGWTGEIYGAFGGSLTAGKLLGFNSEKMGRALGLAYAQASGNSQPIYDGSESTCLQQGFTARAGALSALLAEAGFSGAREFLTGRAGLYPVYYRGMDYNVDRLAQGLGDRYEFLNIATKPYPSCGFTMAPIENVIGLMEAHQLSPDDIERVIVSVNKKMHATVCAPEDRKFRPQEPADALFSMPYVIATGVLKGDVVLEDFAPEAIDEQRRSQLMERIQIIEDQDIEKEALETNMVLGTHSIRIDCKDGRKIRRKMNYSRGFPQNPMTIDQCAMKAKKVISSSVRPIPETRIDEMKKAIENLEIDNTLESLICLMS